jgi:hypothetical protein
MDLLVENVFLPPANDKGYVKSLMSFIKKPPVDKVEQEETEFVQNLWNNIGKNPQSGTHERPPEKNEKILISQEMSDSDDETEQLKLCSQFPENVFLMVDTGKILRTRDVTFTLDVFPLRRARAAQEPPVPVDPLPVVIPPSLPVQVPAPSVPQELPMPGPSVPPALPMSSTERKSTRLLAKADQRGLQTAGDGPEVVSSHSPTSSRPAPSLHHSREARLQTTTAVFYDDFGHPHRLSRGRPIYNKDDGMNINTTRTLDTEFSISDPILTQSASFWLSACISMHGPIPTNSARAQTWKRTIRRILLS